MGKTEHGFQDVDYILNFFGGKIAEARGRYLEFVKKGVAAGRRPDLTGGGLVRSAGGWSASRTMGKAESRMKGDERILDQGDFVETVLKAARENLDRKSMIRTLEYDFEWLMDRVAGLFGLTFKKLLTGGKQRRTVTARSVLCYWGTQELGMSAVGISKKLNCCFWRLFINLWTSPRVPVPESFEDATMNPRIKIATARTPDGGEMVLYQHERDFSIKINGQDLMHSRQHESELELARLGCAHLAGRQAASVLIGGLGLGYTLRQALDLLSPRAQVVVSELLDAVVGWQREFLGELNGRPLADERVDLKTGDIVELISRSESRFDAILLDIDNGPSAITDSGNRRLYGREGIQACRRALREQGCLAVWSAEPSKKFEQLLMSCSFHVRRFPVSAYKGSKSQSRCVWVASEDKNILPPGGGQPRLPLKKESKGSRRLLRGR